MKTAKIQLFVEVLSYPKIPNIVYQFGMYIHSKQPHFDQTLINGNKAFRISFTSYDECENFVKDIFDEAFKHNITIKVSKYVLKTEYDPGISPYPKHEYYYPKVGTRACVSFSDGSELIIPEVDE